jgi:hypothetical protein
LLNESSDAVSYEPGVLAEIERILVQRFGSLKDGTFRIRRSLIASRRYLKTRTELGRNFLQTAIEQLLASTRTLGFNRRRPEISLLIDQVLNVSRRHWPLLPAELNVLAHTCRGDSSALQCEDLTGSKFFWIEGALVDKRFLLFGRDVTPLVPPSCVVVVAKAAWNICIPVSDFEDLAAVELLRHLPAMCVRYAT